MYKKVRIHKDLLEEVKKVGNELFMSKLESQVAILLQSGIQREKNILAQKNMSNILLTQDTPTHSEHILT